MGKVGKRCIDIDFHFAEQARNLLVDARPAEYARRVKQANADSIMIYAKDHWGNVYHETQVAHKHPAVKGDFLREVLAACREEGLSTTVFFSIMWDEWIMRQHPEWIVLDAAGAQKHWYGSWTFLCINSPYRDHAFAHLAEIANNYDFDTIFVDPFNYRLGVNAPCYCKYCQQLWYRRYGYELPRTLQGEQKARYMDFRDWYFGNFLREVRDIVHRPKKGIQMTHIYGTIMDYDDYLNVEGDPFGQDYYTNSISTKIYRQYAAGRPLQVLTERFSRYWDFTMKSPNQLQWEAASIFSHGVGMMIVDHADIRGKIYPEVYKVLGDVLSQAQRIETAVQDTKPFAEIALLFHERDEELQQEPKTALSGEKHLATIYRGHIPDFVGAYKLLTEAHLPFDILVAPQLTFERLAGYKVLIVANVIYMSEEQIDLIKQWVGAGGKLIFTYNTATRDEHTGLLDSAHRLFGLLDFQLEDPYGVAFAKPTEIVDELRYVRINSELAYLAPETRWEVLAQVVLTALERTERHWVTHNEIPGDETDYPAIIIDKEGKYGYFAFRFFKEALEQDLRGYRQLFLRTLSRLYSPRVWVEAPRSVESIYQQGEGVLKVCLTNVTIGRPAGRYDIVTNTPEPLTYPTNIQDISPVLEVTIRTTIPVASAATLDGNSLDITTENGVSAITLPRLNIYDVVFLKVK
jgi:hypothetical protein